MRQQVALSRTLKFVTSSDEFKMLHKANHKEITILNDTISHPLESFLAFHFHFIFEE